MPLGLARAFRSAYLTCAAEDLEAVRPRTQMLASRGITTQSEIGEPKDLKEINRADVLLMFWSLASQESEWVRTAVVHALQRRALTPEKLPEICPVPMSLPPAEGPPGLDDLHFNDRVLYFI